jgi:hypothetical protein
MWSTFWHERHGIRSRDEIGVDKIMYSTDYPHGTTTWPKSVWCRTHSLQDVVSVDDRKKILMDNCHRALQARCRQVAHRAAAVSARPITVGPQPETAKPGA